MKAKKLVYGKGVNDSDTPVYRVIGGKGVVCKIYSTWSGMIGRCYSARLQEINPTYIGCTVADEWHSFNCFRGWVLTQDWEGKQLDKDILEEGNKVYSADTCAFVTGRTNMFVTDSKASRGDLPIGVSLANKNLTLPNPYLAGVMVKGKKKHLGLYATPEEAHQSYRVAKYGLAIQLASEQSDPRVAAALIERYKL